MSGILPVMSCVHVVCLFTLNVLFVACVQVLSFLIMLFVCLFTLNVLFVALCTSV